MTLAQLSHICKKGDVLLKLPSFYSSQASEYHKKRFPTETSPNDRRNTSREFVPRRREPESAVISQLLFPDQEGLFVAALMLSSSQFFLGRSTLYRRRAHGIEHRSVDAKLMSIQLSASLKPEMRQF